MHKHKPEFRWATTTQNLTCRDLHGQVGTPVRAMDFRDHSTAPSGVIALPALIEDGHRPAILHFACFSERGTNCANVSLKSTPEWTGTGSTCTGCER